MNIRFILFLLLGIGAGFSLSGQDPWDMLDSDPEKWVTYQSDQGWELQVPEKARREDGDFARWGAWFGDCWLEWAVGLTDKETEIHFRFPMVKRFHDEWYEVFPAELNPGLATRKGFRPSMRRWVENERHHISVLVDFDEKNLLTIYFEFPVDRVENGDPAWKKVLATVKAKAQGYYPVSKLVSGYFDPVKHTPEEVAGLEGPLKGKVDHFYWQMPEHPDWDSLYYYDPLVAALPDGGFVVAWRDSFHLTQFQFFSADFKPRGPSVPIPGFIVHTLTGDNQGFAALCSKFVGDYFEYNGHTWLIAFDMQGKKRFQTEVVGTDDISVANESVVFRRRKNQNLAFSGTHYGVYVSIEHNFGPGSGVHEGDYTRYYDEKGVSVKWGSAPNSPEWGDNWGVSHSFTKAMCWDGEMFCYLTVGDGHPRGLAYKRCTIEDREDDLPSAINVWPIPGDKGDNNVYSTVVNGLAANKDLVVGVFESLLQTRPVPGKDYYYQDIYLFTSNKSGTRHNVRPLQVTPGYLEANPRIVRYRDFFLLVWSEKDITLEYPIDSYTERYLLLNEKGEKISRPEKLPTWFQLEAQKTGRMLSSHMADLGGSELVQLKSGDVVWLRYLPDGNAAEIVRVRK